MMSRSQNQEEIMKAAVTLKRLETKGLKSCSVKHICLILKMQRTAKSGSPCSTLQQLNRLSLKGRILLLGILQYASNEEHIELAMRVAGQVKERDAVPSILQHAQNPSLFVPAFKAMIQLGDGDAMIKLLNMMDGMKLPKAILEENIMTSKDLYRVGDSIIPLLFEKYTNPKIRVYRPIYANGIHSSQR